MDRNSEFNYLVHFVSENCLIEELARDRIRALWAAYCFHHSLDVDTAEYYEVLSQLWEVVSEVGDGTTEWLNYESFDLFMGRYLS